MWAGVVMMEVKRIAQAYKELVKKYIPEIEKFKSSQQMGVADTVQLLLDFLHDRRYTDITRYPSLLFHYIHGLYNCC